MSQVVIGLGFGDEGKGMFTDYLVSKNEGSMVMRISGGHQVGHMVHTNGIRHVFSNFGSGTLRGAHTFWGAHTVDPVGLVKEYKVLKGLGVDPSITIPAGCPITTPFDKIANLQCSVTKKCGTVGVGFGKTIEREERFYSLLFIDLFYPIIFREKLRLIEQYYGIEDADLVEFYEAVKELKDIFTVYCEEYASYTNDKEKFYSSIGNGAVYEGSQGLMLDPHIGFFPHVTRSEIVPSFSDPSMASNYYLLTRAYTTRHGNGFMPNEHITHFPIKINPYEVNVDTGIQGKFRRTMLDVDTLEYAYRRFLRRKIVEENNTYNLVITCLDHLEEYKFTYKERIQSFRDKYEFCENVRLLLGMKHLYISTGDTAEDVEHVS